MKIYCEINFDSIAGAFSIGEGVRAVCARCGHETESYGVEEGSVKRCMAVMREECPKKESNFYTYVMP